MIVKADGNDEPIPYRVFNSDGEEVLNVVMDKGIITIIGKSAAASSSSKIRWRTIGVHISRNPITTKDTYYSSAYKKTYPGVGPVSDSGSYAYIPFSEGTKESYQIGNTVITTITLSEDLIKRKLDDDFKDITENTPIYLHAMFQTYNFNPDTQKETGVRKNDIRDWKSIMTAESWSNPDTLNDFAKYYNMKILFKAKAQDNQLHFLKDDGSKLINPIALDSLKPGKTLSWSTDKTVIEADDGKEYELYKRIIKKKKDTNPITNGTLEIGNGKTVDDIRNGSTEVKLGGMDICLYYRPVRTKAKIKLTAIDQNTGTVIKDEIDSADKYESEKYTQPISNLYSVIRYNSKDYQRTTKCSYTYTKTNGEKASATVALKGADEPFSLTIPPNIKAGSTLLVKIYYQPIDEGDIIVTVNAVNKLTGVTLMTLTIGTVKGGKKFNYTITESKILSGTKYYDYTGTWKWIYTSSGSKVPENGTGEKISFTAPPANKITGGITVNVYYSEGDDVNTGGITLRVIMVTESGSLIYEISKETVAVNQAISKTAQDPKSVNNLSYTYLNKWDYDYTASSGKITKSGTGKNISFTVPSTSLTGTTITLRLYYKALSIIIEVPEEEAPISLELDTPNPYAVINGDKYKASYFTSEKGISTTESQYVFLKTKDYLLGYTLVNHTGKKTFTIPVTMTYTLQYYTATPIEFGGPKLVTDTVTDTQNIPVERAYSYWEIANIQYYGVTSAKVNNYSLPNGGVPLTANHTYTDIPLLETRYYGRVEGHVMPPPEASGIYVTAPNTITSSTSDRPSIEYIDLTSYALTMTGEAQVKSDYITFDGKVVLSDGTRSKIAAKPDVSNFVHSPTIIGDKALFTENQVIDSTKNNGVYPSTGNVTYQVHPASIAYTSYSRTCMAQVNEVIIHTPVICVPVVTADNDQWTQLISPEPEAVQIVLDPDTTLNDFTVKISNTLQHSNRLGYLIRDFSRSFIDPEFTSYIARKDGIVRNEVKLSFDVYQDTYNDKNKANDKFIMAGTWFVLGRDTFRFYVPMWVKEGTYTADFRTIAVNVADRIDKTETTLNSSRNNYVATARVTFEISGRIYGLKIYDLSDYPNWENVFRKNNTMKFKLFEGFTNGTKLEGFNSNYAYYYSLGTKNQYGEDTGILNKYTFPLVNGSHPKYKNLGVLKTGYAVRFMLDTTGEMYGGTSSIKITPSFYHVDANGENRKQVDLYYSEEIDNKNHSLIKVGEGLDLVNIKMGTTGNIYNRIPESELKHTAKVQNTKYSELIYQHSSMYAYSTFKLLSAFRTFVGTKYAAELASLESFNDVKTSTGLTETTLSKFEQRWYGNYKIPTDVHVVKSGYDVYGHLSTYGIDYKEDFWLKDGYIIVNFNIVTIDKHGKERLSYINGSNYMNNGNCSMWIKEGAIIQKTDNKGAEFKFKAGDFQLYYVGKKYSDDFEGELY